MKEMSKTVALGLLAVLLLPGCDLYRPTLSPSLSLEQLTAIVEDPASSHEDFAFATSQMIEMGPLAVAAAPALARSMGYVRHDSYLGAQVLMLMGPEAEQVIPQMMRYLSHDKTIIRSDAITILGAIGPSARCAVPLVAERLWDKDPGVRTAAATALERIAGVDVVETVSEVSLSPPAPGSPFADDPEGSIAGEARVWWQETGQYLDWSDQPGNCRSDK